MNMHSDKEILQVWYGFAASQPGSVDSFLRFLRERQNKSEDAQLEEYGASLEQFHRLCSMRLPREKHFTNDAMRMANACQLSAPLRFVQDMVLARNLIHNNQVSNEPTGYRAAFDDIGNLDEISSE
jgi:hypothetical protein